MMQIDELIDTIDHWHRTAFRHNNVADVMRKLKAEVEELDYAVNNSGPIEYKLGLIRAEAPDVLISLFAIMGWFSLTEKDVLRKLGEVMRRYPAAREGWVDE